MNLFDFMTTEIIQALNDLAAAQKRVSAIRANCAHVIIPSDPKWIDASSRTCSDCGESWGDWYCPKKPPAHACEYTRESGEWCIHCGDPDERK